MENRYIHGNENTAQLVGHSIIYHEVPGYVYITPVHICAFHTSWMTHVEYLILYSSVSIICQQDCHHIMVTLLSSHLQWSGSITELGRDNTII